MYDQLDIIRDFIITDQQNHAFLNYEDQVIELGRHPSKKDFIEFYKLWCLNNKKEYDLEIN